MKYPIIQRELTVHLNNGHWYVRPVSGTEVLGPIDYGWKRFNLYPDSFTFGEGLLAGSSIPGSRRLMFCSWSPQWDGFYVSSMGGAAYTFHGVGVNYVALRGRAHETSVLLLNHKNGEIHVRLEPINADLIWAGYADGEGNPLLGFYALQQAIYDRFASEFNPRRMRVFAVGPAARFTHEGAIGSSPLLKGDISAVVDWAGRGGLGSQLLQTHNIAGCIFGGDWEDPDLRDSAEIDSYFIEHFGKKTIQTDLAVTEKYRYFPEFETGGTFGVNMRELNDRILSFNYRSIYASEEQRLKQHEDLILKHYLAQFNEETIKTRKFQHCGEPCPVVCKKLNGKYKKDYEPYQALGPQVGIFDQRAAEVLNDLVDAMGFDAIQVGGTLAWMMELIADGLIPPEEFGLPPASDMRFRLDADTSTFNVVEDSQRNADYAVALIYALLFEPRCSIFRDGIRNAARLLDQSYGIDSTSRAVFLAHGDDGHMVPNQYWVPGMMSSMPMMGKYYVYYGGEFVPPYQLGRKHVERMVYELFNDNSGICRFHRKWAEVITDEILQAHYGLNVDYKAHQFNLARSIYEREHAKSIPWQSERIADLVFGHFEYWERLGLKNEELDKWLIRFRENKKEAALAYWQEIQRGTEDAFSAGAEAIPEVYSDGQKKKIQNQQ
jgi:glyceraldehyde-3-phosphate dehydrogenase (ferredoxin)